MSLHLCVGGFFHRDLAVRGVCRYSSGCPFVSSHQSLGSGWLCFWLNKSWKNSSGLILCFPQRSAMFSSTDLCIIWTVWLLYEAYHPRERAQYCLKWLDLFLCQVLAWRVRTFRIKKGQNKYTSNNQLKLWLFRSRQMHAEHLNYTFIGLCFLKHQFATDLVWRLLMCTQERPHPDYLSFHVHLQYA